MSALCLLESFTLSHGISCYEVLRTPETFTLATSRRRLPHQLNGPIDFLPGRILYAWSRDLRDDPSIDPKTLEPSTISVFHLPGPSDLHATLSYEFGRRAYCNPS